MIERYTNQLALIKMAEREGLDKGEFSYFLDCGEKLGASIVEWKSSEGQSELRISEHDLEKINYLCEKFSSSELPAALSIVCEGIYNLLLKVEKYKNIKINTNDDKKRIT